VELASALTFVGRSTWLILGVRITDNWAESMMRATLAVHKGIGGRKGRHDDRGDRGGKGDVRSITLRTPRTLVYLFLDFFPPVLWQRLERTGTHRQRVQMNVLICCAGGVYVFSEPQALYAIPHILLDEDSTTMGLWGSICRLLSTA
jgi:hypothetical protein